jgi:hypothetical protein
MAFKQSPRQRYKRFDSFMYSTGLGGVVQITTTMLRVENSYVILLLYVNDVLIAWSSIGKINNMKKKLSK